MTYRFSVLDADNSRELELWLQEWEGWPNRDVWGHPHYVRLFANGDTRARCAVFSDERGGQVAYPFLQRPVPQAGDIDRNSDITSAYGYGGPALWGSSDEAKLAKAFWAAFDGWAADEKIVSEFIRFRLESRHFYPGEIVDRQSNYVARLDLDDTAVMRSFEPKVRKNIRRADTSGVEIVVDEHGDRLDEFLDIYRQTMDRRGAAAMYYFGRPFFEKIHQDLPGSFVYFHAVSGSKVVSTELVLISADSVASFLGGTELESFHLRPNDLLKVHAILWAKERGKRRFILGGGAVPGDGIERYKKSFAPAGAVMFQTGQRTLLSDVSQVLVNDRREAELARGRSWPERVDYFPVYRLPL